MVNRVNSDPAKQEAIDAAIALTTEGFIRQDDRYKFGMVLSGSCGMGKTGLLTPVLQHAISQGKSGLWIEMYDFISEIQGGYADGTSNAKLEAAKTADVILLDDLGDADLARPETDDRRRIIYQLINHRHNHGLQTLITTNLDLDGLIVQFGKRIFERIYESCAWVDMAGKNLRME